MLGSQFTGNTTSKVHDAVSTTYLEWDGLNHLRSRTHNGIEEVYHYDHTGKRVLIVAGTKTTWTPGPLERRYNMYGILDGAWFLMDGARCDEDTSTCVLNYNDFTSNLSLSLDESGNVKEWKRYGAFGEILPGSSWGTDDNHRLFNGKWWDPESGLRYYGHRYYDDLPGRWISGDPLYRLMPERGLTDPQKQNLYAFSRNNPISWMDDDGLEPRGSERHFPRTPNASSDKPHRGGSTASSI